jgi:hypothetical protein
LVALAEKYVRLSGELEDTRSAMKRLLMNGGDDSDARPPTRPPISGGKPKRSHAKPPGHAEMMSAAQAAEQKVLDLVRGGMTRSSEIAAATSSRVSTCSERLRRLRQKGLVERVGEGWAAAGTPTPP